MMVVWLDGIYLGGKTMAEKAAKGKVIHKEGKYFLEVAGKMEELPVGLLSDEEFLKEQVGQEVEVFYTIPKSFVAAIKPVGKPGIMLCNAPAEFLRGSKFVTKPTPAITLKVAANLLKEGFITKEVHDKIQKSLG
jgi:hypothetical protein